MVGMVVLAPRIRIGHQDLRLDPSNNLDQTTNRLVVVGIGEAVRTGIVLRIFHSRVPVAKHHHLVIANDLCCASQFCLSNSGEVIMYLGSVHSRVEDFTSFTAGATDQHTVHSTRVQISDRGCSLGGLVVGVGMNG